jgi:hypothetical protein
VGAEIEMIREIATVMIAQGVIAGIGTGSTAMTLRSGTEARKIVEIEMIVAQGKAQTETVAVTEITHAPVIVGVAKNHLGLVVIGTMSQKETAIVAVVLHHVVNISPLRSLNLRLPSCVSWRLRRTWRR